MNATSLPKINVLNAVVHIYQISEEAERFEFTTFDDESVRIEVRRIADAKTYYYVVTDRWIIGYTSDANKAFAYKNNACIYTLGEMVHCARGLPL